MGFLKAKGRCFEHDGKTVHLCGMGLGSWLNLEHFMMGVPGLDRMIRGALETRFPGWTARFREAFFTDADAAYLRSLGVNLVRVPFSAELICDMRTDAIDPEGLAQLDRLLDICDRHGLYCLLDLHAVPGGQNPDWHSGSASGMPLFWEWLPLQRRAAELWGEVARVAAGHRYLAGYDLLNEPVLPGSGFAPLERFHRMAAEAIRRRDGEHLLFVEGSRFAMDFTGISLPDPGASAYTYHFYPTVWDARLNDPGLDPQERMEGFRRAHAAILATMPEDHGPLLCGETGVELSRLGDEAGIRMLSESVRAIAESGAGWCVWSYKDTGVMGLRVPAPGTAWQRLAAAVSERWDHWEDMRRGQDLAEAIDREYFSDALSDEERYRMQFKLRAALFEPEAEHFLGGALDALENAGAEALADSFALENCRERSGYARFLRNVINTTS